MSNNAKRLPTTLMLPRELVEALDREAARLAPTPGARCSRSEAAVRVLARALVSPQPTGTTPEMLAIHQGENFR